MSSSPPDTYGVRIKQYKRREQMAIWVAAGIAALIAFIGARALDGAPRVFTEVIFTCAIAAGGTAAYSRVGFEWQATLLERKVKAEPALKNTPLAEVDQPWPSGPEGYWTACLWSIILAWIVMFIGIWWPRSLAQVVAPPVTNYTELQTFPIGSVGPFADCNADLPLTYENQLDLLVRNYQDHVKSNARATLIILVGAADNRRLTPVCAAYFGTNEQLAVARASNVRARLEPRLSGEPLKPSYVILTSGPRHLEAKAEGEGRRQDRAVDAWIAIDPQGATQKQ